MPGKLIEKAETAAEKLGDKNAVTSSFEKEISEPANREEAGQPLKIEPSEIAEADGTTSEKEEQDKTVSGKRRASH